MNLGPLRQRIRDASGMPDAVEAARRVGEIWSDLQEVVDLAEARMRILTRRLPDLPLAPTPPWLHDEIASLRQDVEEDSTAPAEAVLTSTQQIVRAFLQERSDVRATLCRFGPDQVEVTWETLGVIWLVSKPRVPWPGVSVRVYGAPGTRARSFCEASAVLRFSSTLTTLESP